MYRIEPVLKGLAPRSQSKVEYPVNTYPIDVLGYNYPHTRLHIRAVHLMSKRAVSKFGNPSPACVAEKEGRLLPVSAGSSRR